jgi:hypothetical protein
MQRVSRLYALRPRATTSSRDVRWRTGLLHGSGRDRCGARDKKATGELTQRVAVALDLPEDYFPEARLAFLVERLSNDPELRDKIYDRLR